MNTKPSMSLIKQGQLSFKDDFLLSKEDREYVAKIYTKNHFRVGHSAIEIGVSRNVLIKLLDKNDFKLIAV